MRVAALGCVLCATLASCYERAELAACSLAAGDSCVSADGGVVDVPEGCLQTTLLGTQCPGQSMMSVDLTGDINTTACDFPGASIVGQACVVLGTSVSIHQLHATGDRPLAVISDTTMALAMNINVGSSSTAGTGAGANAGCAMIGAPGSDGMDQAGETFGGGGGAGGSFQTPGAPGGDGEMSGPVAAGGENGVVQLPGLRGGCNGGTGGRTGQTNLGRGRAGDGGGAIYLVARDSIAFADATHFFAGGSGGGGGGPDAGGGGGGGSGGSIIFEAQRLVVATDKPILCANGGGGGGGAENNTLGAPGQDACLQGIVVATGGPGGESGAGFPGGNGGAGSVGKNEGSAGEASIDGGGGGGGGAGFIVVFGGATANVPELGVDISPPVSAL